jgi:pimeloyl-ACP methyl ester carboxylesterase
MPSLKQTKAHLTNSEDSGVLVRIPVEKGEKTVRYHDGTMLFPKEGEKDITNKTVVFYHGNGEHRDNMEKIATEYLDRGYNVLLAAYAGDTVVQGTGDSYTIQPTECGEQYMREDAQADLKFLKELGVKNVAVYGVSLGGAQAMNFAQSIQQEETVFLDFVFLDKTFNNMADAAENFFLEMGLNSPFLAKIVSAFARKFLFETGGNEDCDGFDNEKKLFEISRNQKFAKTKFCILGGANDGIMGNPKFPFKNLATKLHKAIGNQDQVHFELQPCGHCFLYSRDAMAFLFPSYDGTE